MKKVVAVLGLVALIGVVGVLAFSSIRGRSGASSTPLVPQQPTGAQAARIFMGYANEQTASTGVSVSAIRCLQVIVDPSGIPIGEDTTGASQTYGCIVQLAQVQARRLECYGLTFTLIPGGRPENAVGAPIAESYCIEASSSG